MASYSSPQRDGRPPTRPAAYLDGQDAAGAAYARLTLRRTDTFGKNPRPEGAPLVPLGLKGV
jgi:hypothetical protein